MKGDEQLTETTIHLAVALSDDVPRLRRVRVVGKLDMISQSTRSFALKLDNGERILGTCVTDDMDEVAALFGQRVLVHGKAVYSPSGNLLRIDGEKVEPGDGVPSLFSKVPAPLRRRVPDQEIRVKQSARTGVAAFLGKWPGDETDEEWAAMLQRGH